jgi:Phospholipase_D-nuclease N-terminal
MLVAADYPLLEILSTMLVFFLMVSWFWLLIVVIADVFRRQDAGGGKKALWVIALLVLPFIGVFAYLIANSDGMARRSEERAVGRYEPPPTYLDADLPPR